MRASWRRAVAGTGLVALVALAAGCGGSTAPAFRIGVLSDCYGFFNQANQWIVAAAEIPLLQRGAHPSGRTPTDGITAARVAGRRVELVRGCVTGSDEVLPEARRLVEEDGAAALVGLLDPQEGLVLRAYARRRPATIFLVQPSAAPELTLRNAVSNVFRFAPDAAQSVAGLGTYAYRTLRWRTAVTVGDDDPYGWSQVAGFVAEFCALGGHVLERTWLSPYGDTAAAAAHVPAAADGVYLESILSPPAGFLRRYGAVRPLGRRIVATVPLLSDPATARLANGIVIASALPASPNAAGRAYAATLASAFPRLGAAGGLQPEAVAYRDGVEALLEALEAGGSTPESIRTALTRLVLASPAGMLRLDERRQAIVPIYLDRIVVHESGAVLRPVTTVNRVNEDFGGLFPADGPSADHSTPRCIHGQPAPWSGAWIAH